FAVDASDRVRIYHELARQRTDRGQAASGAHPAASHGQANLFHELPIDRHSGRGIDLKFHGRLATVLSVLVQLWASGGTLESFQVEKAASRAVPGPGAVPANGAGDGPAR